MSRSTSGNLNVGTVLLTLIVYGGLGWALVWLSNTLVGSGLAPIWLPEFVFGWLIIGIILVVAAIVLHVTSPAPAPTVESKPTPQPESGSDSNLASGTGSLDFRSTRPSFIRRTLTLRTALMLVVAGLLGIGALAATSQWVTNWLEEEVDDRTSLVLENRN